MSDKEDDKAIAPIDKLTTRQMEPLPPANRRTDPSRYLRGMQSEIQNSDTIFELMNHNIRQIIAGTGDVAQVKALLDLAFENFARAYENQLTLLDKLAGYNETIRTIMQRSFSSRLSNAILVCENLGILKSGDPYWLADIICQIKDEITARSAIAHVHRYGDSEDHRRLMWFKRALEEIDLPDVPEMTIKEIEGKSYNQPRKGDN